MYNTGLPVPGSAGVPQFGGSDATEVEQRNDHRGRDIMLVVAGGEGYIDFRRGTVDVIQLTAFQLRVTIDI